MFNRKRFVDIKNQHSMNMYKFLAIIYRYHKRNFNKDFPYFATLCSILIILFINFCSALAFFDKREVLSFWNTESKATGYFIGFLLFTPAISILALLFPASKIKKKEQHLTDKEYKIGKYAFFLLWVVSLILLFIVV